MQRSRPALPTLATLFPILTTPHPPTPVPSKVEGVRQLSIIPKVVMATSETSEQARSAPFKGKHGRTHIG